MSFGVSSGLAVRPSGAVSVGPNAKWPHAGAGAC